jgi:hypothetical protein
MSYGTAHSYWLTPAKRNPFPQAANPATCWWCGAPADTREHRIKRTDIIREFGHQPSKDHLLVSWARVSAPMRGPKGDVYKFKPSLCAQCNNVRSQPLDVAQERFARFLAEGGSVLAKTRLIRFADIYSGQNAAAEAENLRRYFVKHVACRLSELGRPISRNIAAFMNQAEPLRDIAFSFAFSSEMHRILQELPRGKSGVVGDEDITSFTDPVSRKNYEIASEWVYRAFILRWLYRWDSPEEPINPFSWPEITLEESGMKMPAFFAKR